MIKDIIEEVAKEHYVYPVVHWKLDDFQLAGPILDIGGGGEGVIGKQHGSQVAAIDLRLNELLETPAGPGKVVMDARQLGFPRETFQTAAAFYSLMYVPSAQDQLQVMQEAARALKPGGSLQIWEVDQGELPESEHGSFVVFLEYQLNGSSTEAGYGYRWPEEERGIDHYRSLAEQAGFEEVESWHNGSSLYLQLRKT